MGPQTAPPAHRGEGEARLRGPRGCAPPGRAGCGNLRGAPGRRSAQLLAVCCCRVTSRPQFPAGWGPMRGGPGPAPPERRRPARTCRSESRGLQSPRRQTCDPGMRHECQCACSRSVWVRSTGAGLPKASLTAASGPDTRLPGATEAVSPSALLEHHPGLEQRRVRSCEAGRGPEIPKEHASRCTGPMDCLTLNFHVIKRLQKPFVTPLDWVVAARRAHVPDHLTFSAQRRQCHRSKLNLWGKTSASSSASAMLLRVRQLSAYPVATPRRDALQRCGGAARAAPRRAGAPPVAAAAASGLAPPQLQQRYRRRQQLMAAAAAAGKQLVVAEPTGPPLQLGAQDNSLAIMAVCLGLWGVSAAIAASIGAVLRLMGGSGVPEGPGRRSAHGRPCLRRPRWGAPSIPGRATSTYARVSAQPVPSRPRARAHRARTPAALIPPLPHWAAAQATSATCGAQAPRVPGGLSGLCWRMWSGCP
jgi:hypothetical protein